MKFFNRMPYSWLVACLLVEVEAFGQEPCIRSCEFYNLPVDKESSSNRAIYKRSSEVILTWEL